MNYFDIAILVIVFIFLVMGFRKGLVAEVVGLLGILIAVFLAFRFGTSAADLVPEQFNFPKILNIFIGFILVFGGVFLFFKFLAKTLEKVIHPTALSWLDKSGGLALGAVEGVITASVAIFLFSLTPLESAVENDINDSLFYHEVGSVAPKLFDFAHQMFPVEKNLDDIKNTLFSKFDGSTTSTTVEKTVNQIRDREPRPTQQTNRSTSSGGGQRGRK